MRIKFELGDDLPLGIMLNILEMIVITASVLEKRVNIINKVCQENVCRSYKNVVIRKN